ncbi:MAG TPA: TadE family protein [Bryobacteraceae bacterium]|nr:TadE family protein [Bryobacteraceae bacterium]
MSLHPKRRSRRQRGQALVESVLTLTAFLAIFLGMIEVGEILYVHQTLVERTRSAVRWGAVNAWDATNSPTEITNMVLYGTATPADNSAAIFGLTASNVSVSRPEPDYSAADRIVVTVSGYTLTFFTNAIVRLSNGHQNGHSQFTGLTIQQSQPYEVSNGSSH